MKPGNKSKQEVQSHNRNKLVIGENIVIERAHQIKKRNSGNRRKPRTIAWRFLKFKGKINILKKVKKLKFKKNFYQ